MINKLLSFFSILFLILLTISTLYSCANMASPTGGRYDEEPPVVKSATPSFNSLNVQKPTVEILFDENVKIEKPMEKVIITPPQQNFPVIKSVGKKVVVELKDELLPNTTYTIDFTDAIVDNNEANPIENFSYSFSTGDKLDTMAVSGKVLEAENLEPVTGIYVGLHSNLNDTAFTRTRFDRIGRTDSRGNFTIRGMAPGKYKIFALGDLNRDYKYDNPQEAVAFIDSVIVPSTMQAVRNDTVFSKTDSTKIDTVKTIHYTRFLPDDLLLRSFLSDFQRQYLQKHERPQQHKLSFFFAAPTSPPTFRLLSPDRTDNKWFVKESNPSNDSITLWITDSTVYKKDSLLILVNYVRTDSLNHNFIDTDSLNFVFRQPRQQKKSSDKDGEKETVKFMGVNTNIQSKQEIYEPIRIEFEEPITRFDSTHVKLFRVVDSIQTPVPYRLVKDSLNVRKYVLLPPRWEPGGKYRFEMDSAAFTSYYGLWNNGIDQPFTVKSLEEYGNLSIDMSGFPPGKDVYVELLDKSDKPFRKTLVKDNVAKFQDLRPGTIYARLFIDENGDGKWTTGNYEKDRQPEIVYYYPRTYEIRAFSNHQESWNVLETPVPKQKPLEITKNKPQEKKRRSLNEERQQNNQNQRNAAGQRNASGMNANPSMGNNPFLQR
ncbi:MAG: Ig-like domain-containing protein [Petrimonas sp.]|nr:Ig-like domain-containing protein [Petrimonas sp.]